MEVLRPRRDECPRAPSPLIFRVLRGASWTIAWLLALGCARVGLRRAALYDLPILNVAAAWAFALAPLAAIVFMRGAWRKLGATFFGCALVLAWWLTLKPSNTLAWQPDVARSHGLEVERRTEVTLRDGSRNCDYRTELTTRRAGRRVRYGSRSSRGSTSRSITGARHGWRMPSRASSSDAPPLCFPSGDEDRRELFRDRRLLPAVRADLRRRR